MNGGTSRPVVNGLSSNALKRRIRTIMISRSLLDGGGEGHSVPFFPKPLFPFVDTLANRLDKLLHQI
jgi:hypothetical protein